MGNKDEWPGWLAIVPLILLFGLAAILGGPASQADIAAMHALAGYPLLTSAALTLTQLGGFPAATMMAVAGVAALGLNRRWRAAAVLAGIVVTGRIAVEILKLLINRPRPDFSPYPVTVTSLSFPSGHAANSMITFLALAMLVAPPRLRRQAVAVAVAGSVTVGLTRPILGVHWPSDVLAGWSFGIVWVVAGVALAGRLGAPK